MVTVTTQYTTEQGSQTVGGRSICLVGQKLSTGTATAGLAQNIVSRKQARELFGAKSMLYQGMARYFDVIDFTGTVEKPSLNAVALADDGSAVKAGRAVVFLGTSTVNASYDFYVNNYKFSIDIVIGDTPEEITNKLKTVLDLNLDIPVTYALSTGSTTDDTITFTASNGGTVGNTIRLELVGTVAGITYTIGGSAVTSAFLTGGATDPSLVGVFDKIKDDEIRFTSFVYPAEYDTSELVTILNNRETYNDKVLDGTCVFSLSDTYANLDGDIEGKDYQNNKNFTILPYKPSSLRVTPYEFASATKTVIELSLTPGALISKLTSQSTVTIGGPSHATTPFEGYIVPGIGVFTDSYTKEEWQQLESQSYTKTQNNSNNTYVTLGVVRTLYNEDVSGNPDNSYDKLNEREAVWIAGKYVFNNLKAKYTQNTLTSGRLVKANMENKDSISGYIGSLVDNLASSDYAIIPSDKVTEAKTLLSNSMIIDFEAGVVNYDLIVKLIGQLRAFNGTFIKKSNT